MNNEKKKEFTSEEFYEFNLKLRDELKKSGYYKVLNFEYNSKSFVVANPNELLRPICLVSIVKDDTKLMYYIEASGIDYNALTNDANEAYAYIEFIFNTLMLLEMGTKSDEEIMDIKDIVRE